MSEGPRLLALVVEGPDDLRTVSGLVDRVLLDELPALEGELDGARAFCGLAADAPFLAWSHVHRERTRRPVPRKHGSFVSRLNIEDARTAWYALQFFVAQDPQPAAVFLVRDSDDKQEDRRRGLEQARQEGWPFHVVVGVAHPMRECWVLAGFAPRTRREEAALKAERKKLGFSPTEHSERLVASSDAAMKSAKRVLKSLIDRDPEREAQCWMETDLETLRTRGNGNGLADFLAEVTERLVPIFADQE